jgi:hypothetical protein
MFCPDLRKLAIELGHLAVAPVSVEREADGDLPRARDLGAVEKLQELRGVKELLFLSFATDRVPAVVANVTFPSIAIRQAPSADTSTFFGSPRNRRTSCKN